MTHDEIESANIEALQQAVQELEELLNIQLVEKAAAAAVAPKSFPDTSSSNWVPPGPVPSYVSKEYPKGRRYDPVSGEWKW